MVGLVWLGCVFGGLLATDVVAGPGSGTATISPTTAVVGAPGTWTIEYVAEDSLLNGTIRITIPSGWSPPQISNSSAPGYVTVSSDVALSKHVTVRNDSKGSGGGSIGGDQAAIHAGGRVTLREDPLLV